LDMKKLTYCNKICDKGYYRTRHPQYLIKVITEHVVHNKLDISILCQRHCTDRHCLGYC
jgi:isoprenylcysteine carboxyl methyltransferase (ICMT) family protein YpbQ